MKHLSRLLIPRALASCETTGDPHQGGLFGWSQGKAEGRLAQKRATLDSLQSDTSSVRRRSAQMESNLDR